MIAQEAKYSIKSSSKMTLKGSSSEKEMQETEERKQHGQGLSEETGTSITHDAILAVVVREQVIVRYRVGVERRTCR